MLICLYKLNYRQVIIKKFPVWLRNRLLSAGLEPVLSQTEKHVQHRITDSSYEYQNKNHKINTQF